MTIISLLYPSISTPKQCCRTRLRPWTPVRLESIFLGLRLGLGLELLGLGLGLGLGLCA